MERLWIFVISYVEVDVINKGLALANRISLDPSFHVNHPCFGRLLLEASVVAAGPSTPATPTATPAAGAAPATPAGAPAAAAAAGAARAPRATLMLWQLSEPTA